MIIGILKERAPEKRVALTPETAKALKALKANILFESEAGKEAFLPDAGYVKEGVSIATRNDILAGSDCILTIAGPSPEEIEKWGSNKILIGHMNAGNTALMDKLVANKISAFNLDLLPRTSLAQSMDILSSMATVSGYKAIIDAANYLPRFFPMFMTASGTVKPARVLVLGAGVAGLQALATARRLGAVVEVFDVRSAVKDEVHSLGGKFIEVSGAREDEKAGGYAVEQQQDYLIRQGELIHDHAIKSDVVICTAQIPGKKAPVLLRSKTVEMMMPGSVVVDLAASSGGNCELTVHDSIITRHDVFIIGKTDYPASMSMDASKMYSNNMLNFMRLIIDPSGNLFLDWNNEIVKNTCFTHEGRYTNIKMSSALLT